ncbi:hypothetical protein PQQ53_20135 [Paraburkholderia strydomiana]|uniref:hypothetical protein n=1 Tax=Paraburkholderia strydomiana TaxID=1245417 RepID=UPI0038B7CC63
MTSVNPIVMLHRKPGANRHDNVDRSVEARNAQYASRKAAGNIARSPRLARQDPGGCRRAPGGRAGGRPGGGSGSPIFRGGGLGGGGADGVVSGIEQVTKLLSKHFPAQAGQREQLPGKAAIL